MNHGWTRQQQSIREHYRGVGETLVRPSVTSRDRDLEFDRELWRELGKSGLFGVHMPSEYGGRGLGIWEFAAALEGFAEGCQDMGVLVSFVAQVGLVQAALVSYGTSEQKARWLPGLLRGDKVGCFAITEPECGSDVRGLRLKARHSGPGYRIDGRKWNITNAPVADLCLTFARLEGIGERDITCFVLDTDKPGLRRSEPFELLGNRGTPIGAIDFDNVEVDEQAVLGDKGAGLDVLYFGFLVERILSGLIVTGCMAPLVNDCVSYSRSRKAFGVSIGDNQYVQGHIVDIYSRLELLRSVLFRALGALDRGEDCSRLASIIKICASESLHQACLNAMKIHGNYGYRRDHYFERLLRDSIGLFFAGGTIEVHKHVIWTNLLSEHKGDVTEKDGLNLMAYQRKTEAREEIA